MIRFRALGTEFRMHVLTLLMAALAMALNGGAGAFAVPAAVFLHESGHLIAARLGRVPIEYVEIMPYGGAAHMADLYGAPGVLLAAVALAGPAANALGAGLLPTLARCGALSYEAEQEMIRVNVVLMLFNLMPALPLDGGRVLYAALRRWMKAETALWVCAGMAYALAGAMVVLAAWGWIAGGAVNLTLLLLPVFLVASTQSELRSARCAAVSRAVNGLCRAPELPTRAKVVAMAADTPTHRAARFLQTGETTLFAVLDGGEVREWLTPQGLAGRIVDAEDGARK